MSSFVSIIESNCWLVVTVFLIFTLTFDMSVSGSSDTKVPDSSGHQEYYALSRGISDFTSSFFKTLQKDHPDNLISSPFSLSLVMAMLKVGSRGVSSEEIQRVMKFPNDDSDLLSAWLTLLSTLQKGSNLHDSLATANKIYVKGGFPLSQIYADAISKYFQAETEQLNFGDSPGSAATINAWVAKHTQDKIKKLFELDAFDSLTNIVLVNAIYFKGQWMDKFDPNLTEKREFFVSETKGVEVDMMFRNGKEILYANLREWNSQLISLPFKHGNLSMLILLPNEIVGLPELERKLADVNILDLCDDLYSTKVEISLPKFTIESTLDLNQPLINLGISSIFDGNSADLGGFSDGVPQPLFVSQVIQKAFFSVDEEGAEAAAASGVKIQKRSASFPEIFNANHPFIYTILHHEKLDVSASNQARTILFYGRFSKPGSLASPVKDEL